MDLVLTSSSLASVEALALLRGIRERYPDWRYLIDGDGGDENLKDYPIEENKELTIRSVLNNLMLYQEGWGVDSIKHSLTYSGGQSRSYTRSYAPARLLGFEAVGSAYLASVEFSGIIRECDDAGAVPFRELWMLARPQLEAEGWRLARQLDLP